MDREQFLANPADEKMRTKALAEVASAVKLSSQSAFQVKPIAAFSSLKLLQQDFDSEILQYWAIKIVPTEIAYNFWLQLEEAEGQPVYVENWPDIMRWALTLEVPKTWIATICKGCSDDDFAVVMTNATKLICMAVLLLKPNFHDWGYPPQYQEANPLGYENMDIIRKFLAEKGL